MNATYSRPGKPGFISYVLVLSAGVVLIFFTLFVYRRATASSTTQAQVQVRADYAEKEDAILRAIVTITPNRAIRAMKDDSNSSSNSGPLRWRNIFTEALTLANARTSVDSNLLATIGQASALKANSGDSTLANADRVFRQIGGVNDDQDTSFASAGINRSLGTGFPVPLTSINAKTIARDSAYPIITRDKKYDTLAQGGVGLPVTTYQDFNLIPYPKINFGYAKPGEQIVAKRNWWAFTMDVAAHDATQTKLARQSRDFVLSIYEIPSLLGISSSAFMTLGKYASGEAWQNFTIEGGVFAGKAQVEGPTALPALASRRGMSLSSDTTIGGQNFSSSPFAPGVRESYQVTQGEFFPVSLASESGRVAFVPINRGAEFLDRLALTPESNTLSPTTWNNYSAGAKQCAMRLDITQCVSSTNKTPNKMRFSYMKGGTRQAVDWPGTTTTGLPPGYILACNENQTYDFGDAVVDVAYGKNGSYAIQTGVTGQVTFNNARFGDPLVGTPKLGYFRPSYPWEIQLQPDTGQSCVAVFPKRFANFLTALQADGTAVNSSLVVNVDYTSATGSVLLTKPAIPCSNLDYGVILQEGKDLTAFPKGFSLVTNLRTFIGNDYNTVATTPPAGYTPSHTYYPPSSIFTPEIRYYTVQNYGVNYKGQIGSLASDTAANPVRPLATKSASGVAIAAEDISADLYQIRHPAEVPPITMMNWLVVLEEINKEYLNY